MNNYMQSNTGNRQQFMQQMRDPQPQPFIQPYSQPAYAQPNYNQPTYNQPSYSQGAQYQGQTTYQAQPNYQQVQQPTYTTANINYNQPRPIQQQSNVQYGVNSYDRPPVAGGGCCCNVM